MLNLEERVAKVTNESNQIKLQQRLSARQQRQSELKKAQRRYYIIGEIFCKYFPETVSLEPGTKDENIVIFKPVEDFLKTLSLNEHVIKYLAHRANCKEFWVRK